MDIEEILENIPDKREWKSTTSLKFKRDLYSFFKDMELDASKVVELGTHRGYTTRVLSLLFEEVITYDIVDDPYSKEFNKDRDNITYRYQDIYKSPWWEECIGASVVFIDADHNYEEVKKDIENTLKIKDVCYMVFDDYGLFPSVKNAVTESMKKHWPKIKPAGYVGEEPGSECRIGKILEDWEGLVCKIE